MASKTKVKTVVLVLRARVYNSKGEYMKDCFWGLGDLIRGICDTYEICMRRGIEFVLDAERHPIHRYIKHKPHQYKKYINEDKITFLDGDEVIKHIHNCNDEVCVFMTNGRYKDEWLKIIGRDVGTSEYIRSIFKMPGKVKEVLAGLPGNGEGLNIFHARVGDDVLVASKGHREATSFQTTNMYKTIQGKIPDKINHILDTYQDYLGTVDIVLSDSLELKQAINQRYGTYFRDNIPCHVGLRGSKGMDLLETFVDFFLISKCAQIKSFSFFPYMCRPSGFAYWACVVYDRDGAQFNAAMYRDGKIRTRKNSQWVI